MPMGDESESSAVFTGSKAATGRSASPGEDHEELAGRNPEGLLLLHASQLQATSTESRKKAARFEAADASHDGLACRLRA